MSSGEHDRAERTPMPFRDELQSLINRHSMENGSDTPDFMLAEYLADCLAAFDKAVRERERWYGRGKSVVHQANLMLDPASGKLVSAPWVTAEMESRLAEAESRPDDPASDPDSPSSPASRCSRALGDDFGQGEGDQP